MIGGILSGFFRPILFQKESQNDFENAKRTFTVWILTTIIIFSFAILIYLYLGNILINIFLSKAYSQNAFLIFVIIGIAYAVFGLNQIIENRILSFSMSRKIIIPNLLSAIFNIGANILFIPIWGINGAGYATLLSFIVQLVITIVILNKNS